MRKATPIYRLNETRLDGVKVDMVIWQLPTPTPDRPHGLKYRLWAGRDGKTLVRYDNESGKGDHKHLGEAGVEKVYCFVSLSKLVADFFADIEKGG